MARVYVLGGAGSGKTTLGRALGAALGCPVGHLDQVFFWPHADREPEAARRARREARLRELAAGESWVVEGNFPGWLDELAQRADLVVWLDPPFRVALWRIVTRHVLADLRRNNPHPGYRALWRFLRNVRRYYADTEATYHARLARDPDPWSGATYGRAATAALSAPTATAGRLLHLTTGTRQQILRASLARLGQPAPPPAPAAPAR